MPKRVKHDPGAADLPPAPPMFREYMSLIGRKGGRASGARRLESLTAKQRSTIAKQAARARWRKKAAE